MNYDDLAPITRDEYLALFRGVSEELAGEALLRLSWYEPETKWAERECSAALTDVRSQVRLAAVLALGQLARRQKGLENATVARLLELKTDPDLAGRVEDVLDDLTVFVRPATAS